MKIFTAPAGDTAVNRLNQSTGVAAGRGFTVDDIGKEDRSFRSFMSVADGNPIIPSGKYMRIFWVQQLHLYSTFLETRSQTDLERTFGVFGRQKTVDSLRIDNVAKIPFSGEWFSRIKLGRDVTIRSGAILMAHGRIGLGDGSIIGENALLITVGHPIHPTQRHLQTRGPLEIGKNAVIGADATVVNSGKAEPVVIGEGSIVLPGAIVTKDVPPFAVVGQVNKVLLQGRENFLDDPALLDTSDTLPGRLTPAAIEKLEPFHPMMGDITFSNPPRLSASTKVYHGKSPEERYEFFHGSSKADLDTCVIHAPIFVTGRMPKIENGMILNRGCSIATVGEGSLSFSRGTLLAPRSSAVVEHGASLNFEPITWVGAGAQVVAPPNRSITIGEGSVLAAGAKVTSDVPPMSLILGEGKVARAITDDDRAAVPPSWMDIKSYREYHVLNMKAAQSMAPEERDRFIQNTLREWPNGAAG